MDEEMRALVQEGLALYKRHLDLCEENQKHQLALAAANQKRLGGWQPKLTLIAAFVAMALVMGVVTSIMFPLMDRVLNR
jgi:hypothetical protein